MGVFIPTVLSILIKSHSDHRKVLSILIKSHNDHRKPEHKRKGRSHSP